MGKKVSAEETVKDIRRQNLRRHLDKTYGRFDRELHLPFQRRKNPLFQPRRTK